MSAFHKPISTIAIIALACVHLQAAGVALQSVAAQAAPAITLGPVVTTPENIDYNGNLDVAGGRRPLAGSLNCPDGYAVTSIGYKDGETGDLDGADGFTIACSRINGDGTLSNTTANVANGDIDGSSRFLANLACPAGSVYVTIRQKDEGVPGQNFDALDGITTGCAPLSASGLGALLPAAPTTDIDPSADPLSNPRTMADFACPGGSVLVGFDYDQFANTNTAAYADTTDSIAQLRCRQIIVASGPSCRPLYSGTANVSYVNGRTFSNSTRVSLPISCQNPSVVTQTVTDSVLCGTGSGPSTCINSPGSASTDVHSYVANVDATGFDVFLSADDNVWVGSSSPQYPINWQVICGDTSLPVCTETKIVSGIVNTVFFNGQPHSQPTRVNLPNSCGNPSVVTQSYTDSVLCGTGAGPATCINTPGSASVDLSSYVGNISTSGFDVYLSADDNVWVGNPSPQYPVAYHAMCQNPVSNGKLVFGGTTTVGYVNGQPHSQMTHVSLPTSCQNPSVVTQTYQESVQCGTGAGPATCINNPASSSTDLYSYAGNITSTGFDVYLSADDNVWVGASSPQFPIAWHVTCDNALPASSSSSLSSSSSSSSVSSSLSSSSSSVSSSLSSSSSSMSSSLSSSSSHMSSSLSSSSSSVSSSLSSSSSSLASSVSSVSSSSSSSFASSVSSASSSSSIVPQCRDGVDNDSDGVTDYPNDFSCSGPDDNDETFPKAQCQDGLDNDNDGKIDFPQDPGCSSFQDNDEFNAASSSSVSSGTPQCRDGVDNDSDGATDYPNDFSCSGPDDNDETFPKAQCQDGLDNDNDGKIDFPQDPGCSSFQDNDEFNAASSSSSSSVSSGTPQCRDGIDNDGDGSVDLNDFSCSGPDDNDETNPKAQCQDGIDNDGDGRIDMNDPGCSTPQDNDEYNPSASSAPALVEQCRDGIDNDGDGRIDANDAGCHTDGNPNNAGSYNPYRSSEFDQQFTQLPTLFAGNPFFANVNVPVGIVNNNNVSANANANANANSNPVVGATANPVVVVQGQAAAQQYSYPAFTQTAYPTGGYGTGIKGFKDISQPQYVALLPQTGLPSFAGDLATQAQAMQPMAAATGSVPAFAWFVLSSLGVSLGGTFGRKLLF